MNKILLAVLVLYLTGLVVWLGRYDIIVASSETLIVAFRHDRWTGTVERAGYLVDTTWEKIDEQASHLTHAK